MSQNVPKKRNYENYLFLCFFKLRLLFLDADDELLPHFVLLLLQF